MRLKTDDIVTLPGYPDVIWQVTQTSRKVVYVDPMGDITHESHPLFGQEWVSGPYGPSDFRTWAVR